MKFELVEPLEWPVDTPVRPVWEPGTQARPHVPKRVTTLTPLERMRECRSTHAKAIAQVIASIQPARARMNTRIAEQERDLAKTGQIAGELPESFRPDRFSPGPAPLEES